MGMTQTQRDPDKFVVEYADGSPSHMIEGVGNVSWDSDDVRMYADADASALLFLAPMTAVRCVRKVVSA